jgi:hypothetical protein
MYITTERPVTMMLGSPSAKYKVGIQAQGLLLFLFVATFFVNVFLGVKGVKELSLPSVAEELRQMP